MGMIHIGIPSCIPSGSPAASVAVEEG